MVARAMLSAQPPVKYCSPPKPRRLPARKQMTIALGILAKDGVVLAADTQETFSGVFKVDQAKILATVLGTSTKNDGVFGVSGAGSGGHIDAISQELCDSFWRQHPKTLVDVGDDIRKRVSDFHAQHVLPYSTLP